MTVMPSCITEMAGEPSSIKADPSDSSRRLRSIRAREPIESAMHLHGWESLKRLIGKRRRTISLDLSRLLSPSNSQSNSTHDGIHHGETQASTSSDEKDWAPKSELHGAFDKEWVSCPVCGRLIRGIDYNVNSHLDACLTRGTKRKLTQSNLLQFQFSKRNRTEPILDDIYSEEADNACTEYNHENECGTAFALPKDLSGIRNGNICESDHSDNFPSHLGNFTKTLPPENTFLGDSINQVVDSCDPYICPHLNKDELDEQGTKDANCVMTFVSYIVGRRFHASVELQQGARILLARDSKNVKDRNAIMVLGADSDCRVMLGYLPRELSKYLSPLIDNHYIECEGFVDSLPHRAHDHVPIKLVCRKSLDCAESKETCTDCDFPESLWDNLVVAIENIKVHQPKMIKYQNNFSLMIEEVISHHSHLFTIEEKTFIGYFTSLSDEGQRLFIRIYTRKGPWFRVSNISYSEIQDVQKAIAELQLAGFIYSFHSCDDSFTYNMKEVLDLLNVSEMRQIISSEVHKKGINCSRRNELVNILCSAYASGACPLLPKMILEQTGTCIRISSLADVFWRIQRLFFLNGDQDLSEFLLVDLGIIKFPDYVCNVSHQIFEDRSDLTDYEEAIEVAQIVDESLEANNVEMVTRCIDIADVRMCTGFTRKHDFTTDPPPHFYSCFSASFVYSKVLSLGVSFFEREHRYEDAIRILKGLLTRVTRDSRRGYWTLRLSVNLEHMNYFNESLSVAEEGILDPWVRAGSKMALQRRVLRLGKPPRRWRVPDYADSVKRKIKEICITGRPLTNETASKNMYYGYDDELCGVEQLALQYYAEEGGWSGIHSEGGIWMTIYGLLMWDVIFSNVPDVFISRFQTAPLDFDTDDFYTSREHLIECQLQKIEDGMAEEILICSWESHMGVACRGVNWERHSLPDLRAAVSCIGGCPLASLCRHLAVDYRSWSSGMPDLLLWRFHGDSSRGEAKLVEVKGPSDRLSEQQRAWLLILMDCGFDAEVCKVRPLSK